MMSPQPFKCGSDAVRQGCRILGLTVICTVAITGCSFSNKNTAPPVPTTQAPTTPPAAAAPSVEPGKAQEAEIKLYFGDAKEDQLHVLTKKIRFSQLEEKYRLTLQGLQDKPEGQLVSLFQSFTFRSIKAEQGKVTVDLEIAPEGHYGASGEELVVQALTDTLFQFEEVKAIDLLVEGKATESLMGHVALPHPIQR